jgi:sulfate permease, SulP family
MNANSNSVSESGLFRSVRPLTRPAIVRNSFAGVQLAAMNIPQVLGYARIAGTPFVTGLYTLLLPMVGFAAFGSSRSLVVAADSATAAILAGGISPMAPAGSARYLALASAVALLTAAMLLIARILKLGFVADFLSRTVLVGFLTGIGFQVGIAVLPEMLGLEVRARRPFFQLVEVVRGLSSAHLLTLWISLGVLAIIWVFHRLSPKFPGPLVAVVGGIVASALLHFSQRGVEIIGSVAGGLPRLSIPRFGWGDAEHLIPLAASCMVVIVAQSAATARAYALRHEQALDENADLVGLAAANVAAGFSGTFVVNGSPTQTAMVESSGGTSQLAQIVTAAMVAAVLLFLTGPFQYLPRCVLGAVVFVIGVRLIDFRGLRNIRRESPGEYALAVMTAAVVVVAGVGEGIILAMVVSLLRIVRHSYRPHSGVLVPSDTAGWQSLPPRPGAITEPGLIIYRFGAPLFYANVARFAGEISALVGSGPSPVRWVIVDAEAMTNLDYSAAHAVRELQKSLAQRGTALVFARVHPELQADLDRHHLAEAVGPEHVFSRLHDAIAAYRALPKPLPPVTSTR